ncbi:MAG: Asp-tRNA(Asn)/Glu-tRNA(Gln) amidotransferase GatCAB subunit B, partial [Synergistaceae bacterium]|nr:Asp-tRNA(Asn)/Glu-tRNA(Gln) amidotransferase GatCAB subunit B [Synergistaceae bacterium]
PELPWEKRARFAEYGLSKEEIAILTEQKDLAEYYEAAVSSGAPPARAANWVRMEVLRVLNELSCGIGEFKVKPETLAELVKKVEAKELSSTVGKEVLDILAREDVPFDEALKRTGARAGRLTGGALETLIGRIISANSDVVETIKSGQDKKGGKLKFLQGQIMKEAKGQADPREAASLLAEKLE